MALYVPTAHTSHADEPVCAWKRPASQTSQSVRSVSLARARLPVGHAVQTLDDALALYVPSPQNSQLDAMVVTDTIALSKDAKACSKIRQLSIAGLLAETIRRVSAEESVSSLYVD